MRAASLLVLLALSLLASCGGGSSGGSARRPCGLGWAKGANLIELLEIHVQHGGEPNPAVHAYARELCG